MRRRATTRWSTGTARPACASWPTLAPRVSLMCRGLSAHVSITPPPLRASIEGAAYYAAPPFKKTQAWAASTSRRPTTIWRSSRPGAQSLGGAGPCGPRGISRARLALQGDDRVQGGRLARALAHARSGRGFLVDVAGLARRGRLGVVRGSSARRAAGQAQSKASTRPKSICISCAANSIGICACASIRAFTPGGCRLKMPSRSSPRSSIFFPGSCADAKALTSDSQACELQVRARRGVALFTLADAGHHLPPGQGAILALRQEAQHELGPKFSAQRFHLEFMKQGTIPAGYFGAELLRTLAGA
jgi:hypothetical protein